MEKMPKNAENFICEKCNFICSKKSNFEMHLLTAKHKNRTFSNDLMPKNAENQAEEYLFNCKKCNKGYKVKNSLWYHEKKCNLNEDLEKDNNNNNDNKDELIQYLISENKEFKNLILEVCKNVQGNNTNNINNNITHTNSHNKTFNLQFFLNETCKDAMNMSEFIDSVKLQLTDLESVGKLGFVDGISNIIIKNLEALDVQKRPVHCSDSKRETMYIKEHDKWEKDDSEMKQIKELVRNVRDKNISLIATWRDLYPECVKSNSKKTSQFNQICMEAFGGETGGEKGTKQEKEDKIISRIAKSVVIDKVNV
jgi:hypothetical protein